MPELWANNATSTLAAGITSSATSLSVQAGDGAKFPSPSSPDFFFVTLDDGTHVEIVKVTAVATDALTIVRAQQGTTGFAFSAGAKIEIRMTRDTLAALQGSSYARSLLLVF